MDYEKASASSKALREEVGQFRYPRTGPQCERGTGSISQGGVVVHKMMTREEAGIYRTALSVTSLSAARPKWTFPISLRHTSESITNR
jgi:hypothetical protein